MPYASSSSDRRPDPASGPDADEREFDAFTRTQDPLDVAAATWLVRRRNGLDAQGEAELRAWLAADPRHRQAFEDMDAIGTCKQVRVVPAVRRVGRCAVGRARSRANGVWSTGTSPTR
jgi:transmembrane sensor